MAEIQIPTPSDFAFDRTVRSHGWFDLPPFAYDREAGTLRFAYQAAAGVVSITVRATGRRGLVASVSARGAKAQSAAADVVRTVLRLDQDLAPIRAALARTPALVACVDAGGGRLMRAPTVFEDVTKMLCTTNCSWGLTRVMVGRRREGRRARPRRRARLPDGRGAGPQAAAFLPRRLELLRGDAHPSEAVYARLRSIVGIGPYAADNLMRLLGHNDRLGLDSWCRARYRKLYPRTPKAGLDAAIARRYRPYSPYSGLAMWLDLTRRWHEPDAPGTLAP